LKSDDKGPEKGQVPLGICRFCMQMGHHMKDCVEFAKWLHKKGIPFREEWTN
jgi:hypothetical protein